MENIPTRVALVCGLKKDPVFSYTLGFGFYGKVPSEATLSRYFNKLAESDSLELVFQNLIEKAYQLDIIDPETIAIDASKLNCYERSKPKTKIDKDDPNTSDWGSKLDSHKNKLVWFGWKVHLAVDTESELPLAVSVTPTNESDGDIALPLVGKVSKVLTGIKCGLFNFWTMDSAYDRKTIYEDILFNYNGQAIISINIRNSNEPPAGYYDYDGTPTCSAGHKMVYWGHYNGDNKFRCPHVLGKVNCVHGSAWCLRFQLRPCY